MNLNKADLQKEVSYKTSRSGGPGGQNVNKVASKVELLFRIETSLLFTDDEKALLLSKLQPRFNKDGLLQIVCDTERSQLLNKEIALERLVRVLGQALVVPKVRKKLKIPKSVIAARLNSKKMQSAKKELRKKDLGE